MFPIQNTLPGDSLNPTSAPSNALVSLLRLDQGSGKLPESFPMQQWEEQAVRYDDYWSWHQGGVLQEVIGKTKDGRPVYRYPLHLNPVRNFARKHAALLFGEVPDTPEPLVRTLITPKTIYGKPSEKARLDADFAAGVVNEVWTQCNGRSIQYENGTLSQFLGGSVFQVSYVPWRKDLLVPITVKNVSPSLFLPVWSPDSYYDLFESWTIYRVASRVAVEMWGSEYGSNSGVSVLYADHWTRNYHEVLVDGKPLITKHGSMTMDYTHEVNPFGFVPLVYTPRLREGSYYGSSMIPDIAGLAFEFNSRAADEGDAMRKTVSQRYIGRNITGEVVERKLDEKGNKYLDLGVTNPALEDKPELEPLDPPKWDKAYSDHKEWLWNQLEREGGLGPIAFGEDEGSQRSALTLAFRMWPSTIVAKAQRTFWTDGLNQLSRYILRMAAIKRIEIDSKVVSPSFEKQMDFAPDWLPMIPRDREAQVNEIILRLQAGAISIEKALGDFGDVSDVNEEVGRIQSWLQFMASVKASEKPGQTGAGAPQDIVTPIASSGLRDQ